MTRQKGNAKRGRRGGHGADGGGGRARGWARGRGRGIPAYPMDESFDVNIQMYADAQLESPPYGGGRGGGGGGHVSARQASAPNSEPHTPNRGRGNRGFRGRGRGRGHLEINSPNRYSDIGIGTSSNVRGRGRGGRFQQRLRPDAPLTSLLYQERPLLRPIVFVPSTLHPVLFDQVEDLLKPVVEEVDDTEQSHLPTAAAVSRVFSGANIQRIESSSETDNDDSNDDDEKEELEVVDFNDVGKLFEQTKKRKNAPSKKSSVEVVEDQFIDAHSILSPSPSSFHRPERDSTDLDILRKRMDENVCAIEKSLEDDIATAVASPFYIDTQPTPIPKETTPSTSLSPSDEFDDDIIVYVAPHPRKGTQTSPERQTSTNGVPDTSEFTPYVRDASFSIAVASSSSTKATVEEEPPQPQPQSQTEIPSFSAPPLSFPTPEEKSRGRVRFPPVTISRPAISRKRKKGGVLRKKGGKGTRSSFRAFGAMHEEAQLHDPRWKERRRGDSDLDWGDTDGSDDDGGGGGGGGGEHDHIENGVESPHVYDNGNVIGKDKGKGKAKEVDDGHGMEVDSDLDLDTMKHFVEGLLGQDAGRHVTMDDLRDEAEEEERRLEREKEGEEDTGEDSRDVGDFLESESEMSNSEADDEDDVEVERVFMDEEAMLISETLEFEDENVEEDDDESEDDDEDEDQTPRTSFRQRLDRLRKQANSSKHDVEQEISDDDDDDDIERHMLSAEKNDFFYDKSDFLAGSDEEFEYFNHKKSKRSKAAELPDDLKILWEKDRLKKAAFKKARYQARMEAAADPLSKKKGGKKGRKAMLTVANMDPTIFVLPNRIIDMVTLIQQIRRFIDDEERETMSLPPTNKATRKNVHELALAFNVKSVSKGNGKARYTTLIKTWKTGVVDVDENKVSRIARRRNYLRDDDDELFVRGKGKGKKLGKGGQAVVPRNREGEEVGKAAPKLGSSNLGFRMLAMMGWSEGDRIGVTGGLQDPLTAIIKNTKLGLGAAK